MKTLLIIIFFSFIIYNYPKWSYKAWYKRCEENSKRPDFEPFSGKKYE